jgi:ornithine cyclodeaminase
LGVIGAGQQAEQEIRAVAEVRALSLIKISTRSQARVNWIEDRLQDVDVEIRFTTAEEAVRDSDIVTTVTPSRTALVRDEWVEAGTHISAMGADDVGKHELDTAILARASLFADHPRQSMVIGEFQHAHREGLIGSESDICAIGSVTSGRAEGRTADDEITVFDSSGIAIQDLLAAEAVFHAAEELNLIQYIDL